VQVTAASWPSASELEDLVTRFRECTLPKREWTHAAHLVVGLCHVGQGGHRKAIRQLRARIRRLNDAHGTINSATSGYHETVTAAYVQLIAAFLDTRPRTEPLDETARLLLASPLADRTVLMTYYSTERLMSVDARFRWMDPDLRSF
jgi:hypothetical protein